MQLTIVSSLYAIDSLSLPGKITDRFNAAYGDNFIAARYCGFKDIPKPVDGEWQHGWIDPSRNIHPEFVIGSDGKSSTRKYKTYFVARNDQVEYLTAHGFKNVHAIGLPVIYTNEPVVERKKGSLLVLPVHSLSDTEEQWNDEEYASYIDSVSGKFNEIVLCLHKSCIDKENWIKAFSKRNIKVVIGADPDDCNTYNRLALLFSRFEYVTTNDIGSHIAYAAYFGAKPSIAGPRPRFERKDYERTVFYGNAPDVLDIVDNWYRTNHYKSKYPFLYLHPDQAESQQKWASFQLGGNEKKPPAELKAILGWRPVDRLMYRLKKRLIHNY
jgi:hypothetical protein